VTPQARRGTHATGILAMPVAVEFVEYGAGRLAAWSRRSGENGKTI
jgi:hypothetical protein